MDKEKKIEYWLTSAELDWKTANDIFESGKNYHFCLFICHLVIEKILKAFVINETENFPPKTHNLLYFSDLAKININSDDIKLLQELNQFQMDTRYPDEKFS